MILPLRRRQPQQHNNNIKTINSKDNDDNNNNNNSIVLPRQRQEVGVCNMRTLCKYATIAILSIGFIYTFVAIGIYLGEDISDYISEWSVVPQFVIPENHLAASKFAMKPTIDNNRDLHDSDGLVIDVLSIGSHIRPEYVSFDLIVHVSFFWLRHSTFDFIDSSLPKLKRGPLMQTYVTSGVLPNKMITIQTALVPTKIM